MLKRSLKRQKQTSNEAYSEATDKYIQREQHGSILGAEKAKDVDEKVLEKVVLGGDDDILEKLVSKRPRKKTKKTRLSGEDSDGDGESKVDPAPAWQDDDDHHLKIKISEKDYRHRYFKHKEKTEVSGDTYKQTLRSQFEKVTGQPSWAKLRWQKSDDEAEESDDEDQDSREMLQSTGNYLSSSQSLPKGTINIKRCPDANKEQPYQCKLAAMEFHPSAQVMLTGGSNQTLALFQVDGKHNPKIQSVYLERYPITSAHFSTDGTEVVLASIHGDFKYYDMIAGRVVSVPKIKGLEGDRMKKFVTSPDGKFLAFMGYYGNIHLISAKSKEWITTLKMNGHIRAIAFASDASKMFSHGDDGEVYVWDMTTRQCIHKFRDDGCIKGTSLAVANNGRYIAAGSESGVVNLYDDRCLLEREPQPLKALMNLTTPCTKLSFNSTSEILAMASKHADKAIKLVHVPSRTVFSNYPSQSDYPKIPQSIDFSINSGYFCVGNNKGRAMLYRLKHYSDY